LKLNLLKFLLIVFRRLRKFGEEEKLLIREITNWAIMIIDCPKCGKQIANDAINVTTDLAHCHFCDFVFRLSESVNIAEIVRLSTPPHGSKITLSKIEDNFEIFLPSKKFSSSDIYPVVFSIFWIVFLVFWTLTASKAVPLFALFSILFWIAGIQMIIGLLISFDEDQIITIKKDRLELLKNRPINSKEYIVKYSDIYFIKMGGIKINNPFTFTNNFRLMTNKFNLSRIQLPTMNTGNKTINFYELASDAEKEWIVRFLNAILRKNNNSI
jgi:hypothetical protein